MTCSSETGGEQNCAGGLSFRRPLLLHRTIGLDLLAMEQRGQALTVEKGLAEDYPCLAL